MEIRLQECLPTRSTNTSPLSTRGQRQSHHVVLPQLRVNLLTSKVSSARCASYQPPPSTPSISTPLWSPSASPNSLDHCIAVHLSVHSIMASSCISKLTQFRQPSSHYHSLTRCISKPTQSRPCSTYGSSLDHDIQVYLETRSITAPPSTSPNALHHCLRVYL